MSYSYTQVTMSQEEYQARLTNIAHNTISYLANQGHITEQECEELLESIIVVPIANNSLFGKLRDYFFGKDTKEDKAISKYIVTQLL